MRSFVYALMLVATLGLDACATRANAPAPIATEAARPQGAQAYDAAINQAHDLEREGRLRTALWWLGVADTISDGPEILADINALRVRISASLETWLNEGDRARKRGATAQATAAYQRALILDPLNARARSALREIDASAMLKAIAHGGGGGPPAPRASGPN